MNKYEKDINELTRRKKAIESEFKKQKNISLEYHDYKIKNRGKYRTFTSWSKSAGFRKMVEEKKDSRGKGLKNYKFKGETLSLNKINTKISNLIYKMIT